MAVMERVGSSQSRWSEEEEEKEEGEVPLQSRRWRSSHIPADSTAGIAIDSVSSMEIIYPKNASSDGSPSPETEEEITEGVTPEIEAETSEMGAKNPESELESKANEGTEVEEEAGKVGVELKLSDSNGNGHTMVHDDSDKSQDLKSYGLEKISVHFDKGTGTESSFKFSKLQYNWGESSYAEEKNTEIQALNVKESHLTPEHLSTTITKPQSDDSLSTLRLSSFDPLPSLKQVEEEITSFKPIDKGKTKIEAVFPIEESDQESPELDIVKVLIKQDTHDLFCPNCNSCITRRVILKKRKRKVQDIHYISKRDKYESIVDSELNNNNSRDIGENSTEAALTPTDDYRDAREPDLFRCLSCFTYFIPKGNGFKLFRCFGDWNDNEDLQTHQQPTTNDNWFFNIFSSNKGKIVEQGETISTHSEIKVMEQTQSSVISNNNIRSQQESGGHPVTLTETKETVNVASLSKPGQVEIETQTGQDMPSSSSILGTTLLSKPPQIEEFEEDSIIHLGTESNQQPMFVKTTVTYSEKTTTDVEVNKTGDVVQTHSEVKVTTTQSNSSLVYSDIQPQVTLSIDSGLPVYAVQPTESHQVGHEITQDGQKTSSFQGGKHLIQSSHTDGHRDGVTTQLWNDTKYVSVASNHGVNRKDDNLSIVAELAPARVTIPQRVHNIAASQETEPLLESGVRIDVEEQDLEPVESLDIDILKSIVYGGLIESITSLGVVTSAAGAGASILNVLALGLANLIGGLFIIGHDLWELKDDHPENASRRTTTDQVTLHRYNDLLGRRENFKLHMVIAILSYLISGLIPPIVYGFSFRASGEVYYKLTLVSAVSLICVVFLALGKGHVKKPPRSYFKTLAYYVSIAVMASGVSFIVGGLIKKLIDQLGWLDSSSSLVGVL